jgi:protein transport protein SEC31
LFFFSAELKPVVLTLTKLFDETSALLRGAKAPPAKKREIRDNCRKLGELFIKLNTVAAFLLAIEECKGPEEP